MDIVILKNELISEFLKFDISFLYFKVLYKQKNANIKLIIIIIITMINKNNRFWLSILFMKLYEIKHIKVKRLELKFVFFNSISLFEIPIINRSYNR